MIPQTLAKTRNYNPQFSPINLTDLSQFSGISLKNKTQPSSLSIFENKVYVGTRNSRIYIYTINGDKLTNEEKVVANYKVIFSITISPLYFLITPETSEPPSFSVWDRKTKNFQIALKGHKSQISSIIFLEKDGHVATASWDTTIKIWFIQETFSYEEPIIQFLKGEFPILQMKLYSEEVLVFGDDDCYVTFWNWKKEEIVDKVLGHAGSVSFIYPFDDYLLTGGGDNIFKIMKNIPQLQELKKKGESYMSELKEKSEEKVYDAEQEQNESQEKVEKKFQTIFSFHQNYDPRLKVVEVGNHTLVMDYEGRMFLLDKVNASVEEKALKEGGNPFWYNENVVGIVIFGEFLIAATTKSAIKFFKLAINQKPSQQQNGQS